MAESSEFPLNEGTVRFADLVPIHPQCTGNSRGVVDLDAEFTIVEPRWTPTRSVHRPAAAGGFTVMGRRRRGAGPGAEYRCRTAELLIAHAGRWRVSVGDDGRDGSVELGIGDVMSVPAGAIRRVERLDEVDGFLFVVRGSDEHADDDLAIAGCAVSPQGDLLAIRSGQWIDDSGGIPVLRTLRAEEPPTGSSRAAPQAARWVCPAGAMQADIRSAFDATGVAEAFVIGPDVTTAGSASDRAGIAGRHGFSLRLLTLESGAYVPAHRRAEPFAYLLQDGTLEVRSSAEASLLGAGDVLSMPPGLEHALRNTTSRPTRVFVVLGADEPSPPDFASRPLPGRA
ncbi:MAG: cupin domain-containing protein [Gammaproteobacteria bacterium]|nr:cupin domain-containing protein [Gammaproteobacteria bacterium]